MFSFNSADYGDFVSRLTDPTRLCDLGPGEPNSDVLYDLRDMNVDQVFENRPIANRDLARCCVSGLWLLHDFLEESHNLSQSIGSSSGSYWHGIMHRREPDYPNAKYWFHRTGEHPIFEDLCVNASGLAREYGTDANTLFLQEQHEWEPYRFIDLCESATKNSDQQAIKLCQEVSRIEWQLLFDYCYRNAIGS